MLVVKNTEYIVSCKSNYHTITTTMVYFGMKHLINLKTTVHIMFIEKMVNIVLMKCDTKLQILYNINVCYTELLQNKYSEILKYI
jgi:hydrogenase maturation factor HypE